MHDDHTAFTDRKMKTNLCVYIPIELKPSAHCMTDTEKGVKGTVGGGARLL